MTLTPLITAAEGFPALERLVAGAQNTLVLSFRIIDPNTRLRTPELQAQGLNSWADLLAWTSRRGVSVRMLISDFDPLFAKDLHRSAWSSASAFATRLQGDGHVMVAPHGQVAGALWSTLMRKRVKQAVADLKQEDPARLTPIERAILSKGPVLRPVTLHQKFAVADSKLAIIGGLDINERRYDDTRHARPTDETWHDVSVEIDDTDFAGALSRHFADCWNAALQAGAPALTGPTAQMAASARPQGRTDLRLLRTLSTPQTGLKALAPTPQAIEHETALISLFENAQSYIYLETQFLRHAPLAQALCQAALHTPALNLIVVLPAAPDDVLFDGDDSAAQRHAVGLQVARLQQLRAAFGTRLALLTPAQPGEETGDTPILEGADPIYLHSKLTLIDDDVAVIGSANLNGRSMRWDTEASALIRNPDFARSLRKRVASIWLRHPDSAGDTHLAATWQRIAEAQAAMPPDQRKALVMPFPEGENADFAKRLPMIPDEMF